MAKRKYAVVKRSEQGTFGLQVVSIRTSRKKAEKAEKGMQGRFASTAVLVVDPSVRIGDKVDSLGCKV